MTRKANYSVLPAEATTRDLRNALADAFSSLDYAAPGWLVESVRTYPAGPLDVPLPAVPADWAGRQVLEIIVREPD